jgi:hypothetical protein
LAGVEDITGGRGGFVGVGVDRPITGSGLHGGEAVETGRGWIAGAETYRSLPRALLGAVCLALCRVTADHIAARVPVDSSHTSLGGRIVLRARVDARLIVVVVA